VSIVRQKNIQRLIRPCGIGEGRQRHPLDGETPETCPFRLTLIVL